MKFTERTVNNVGLEEIRNFLKKNTFHDGDFWSPDMLKAWARDAEFSMSEGNPPTIEISAVASCFNRVQEYTISDAGVDSREVEIEE